MTNVTTSFDAGKIMREISRFAPFTLLVCALLSFIAVSIFAVDYYETLFTTRFTKNARVMAILVAVIQEAVRFGLLVSSIRDFSDKKPLNGWLGLIGSLVLVIHDISIANDLALLWNAENPSPYSGILIFPILTGLLLEIRLILTLSEQKVEKKEVGVQGKKSPHIEYSKNGVTV